MKGLILAGGSGTRLRPLTRIISKHLLPIYDKPMIYYSLSVLMQSNVRDVLLISSPRDISRYKQLLGDGARIGINLHYKTQIVPRGISDAFLIGEDFIDGDSVMLILGDNFFYDSCLALQTETAIANNRGATVFLYKVPNPENYGIAEIDEVGNIVSLEEKPICPKSNFCVTGLYVYDSKVVGYAKRLSPSSRGELEITDINKIYLKNQKLDAVKLTSTSFWSDMGTYDAILSTSIFVRNVEQKLGVQIGNLELIARSKNWI